MAVLMPLSWVPSPDLSGPTYADVLFEEESKPQRRKRERGRRSMGSENVAPEAAEAELCAQANAHSSDVAHVFQEAQVHGYFMQLRAVLSANR